MSFLKLMTFNVQLLPSVPGTSSPGNEAEERAHSVADALDSLSAEDRPHVIAFNEVFNEDGRDVLYDRLEPTYPHIAAKLDDCGLGQDSGLMVVSRLPFEDLPPQASGPKVHFFSYPDSKGDDSLACKGVGLVQVRFDQPIRFVTIAFTHTQAFYEFENEYSDVRAAQLKDLGQQLSLILGPPGSSAWQHLVVMGDLNVRGDPAAALGEWGSVFAASGGTFSVDLTDGWRTFMRPPAAFVETDPGYTSNNLEPGENGELPAGLLMRLDYQCFSRLAQERLVPQHMRTRFRTQSDHWSLEADIHLETPACTPSQALMAPTFSFASGLQVYQLDIVLDGSYQWVYVAPPGTYTVFPSPQLDIQLFAASDMSTPLSPYDELPPAASGLNGLPGELGQLGIEPGVNGQQFETRGPFFIRVRAPEFRGVCFIGVLRHRGESIATAINLLPWEEAKDPQLPHGQVLGQHDECWFRAAIGQAHSATPHVSTFSLLNGTGHQAILELQSGSAGVHTVSNSDPVAELALTAVGPEIVNLVLRRENLTDTDFRVGWRSGLTYLRSSPVGPMVLRCVDETGIDAAGGDEITLRLQADDPTGNFFETYWNDADSREILKLEGKVPVVAFVKHIEVWVKEHDFISDPPDIAYVPALSPGDPLVKRVQLPFAVQSGTYRFECTLSRTPD
ncbi:endonuclease/exonuclease/phosphatase family protein [Streptomyces sp. NPDC059805]|uniref:endonuclease/exonuclease/phosphatase family protein n=1 Tax=Streptomyces sp. NPDC059805 TaxID=3346954 RepID=UPI003651874A